MMIQALISKSIIYGANLASWGRLFKTLEKITLQNNSDNPFDAQLLNQYLLSWGITKKIDDVPIMTKADIRRHTENVDPKRVYKVSYTGGSTGEPLRTVYSRKRAMIRMASVFYYNRLAGYRLGDSFLLTRSKDESKFIKFLKNEFIFVPRDLSENKIKSVINIIIDNRIKVLIGYPSVFYALSLYLYNNPVLRNKLKVKSFISSAEPIDEDRLDFVGKAFDCKAFDRYANEENGILAHQRELGGDYIVDRYNFYIEVLHPQTLLPVIKGEVGKVVVTDVYSDLIPIIRYDTGDFAEVSEIRNGQVYSIKKIIGRVVDEFTKTNGEPFSPLTLGPFIRLPLTNLGIHFQFQFAQKESKHYELRLKVPPESVPQKTKVDLIQGLKSVLGLDATIHISYVNEILSRPSGKRPLYVNETLNKL
jgi:phenylacetate-CoA ligase